jgi:hypothetical protein
MRSLTERLTSGLGKSQNILALRFHFAVDDRRRSGVPQTAICHDSLRATEDFGGISAERRM